MAKNYLLLLFVLLVFFYTPDYLSGQQNGLTWDEIKKIIRTPGLSYEKKIEMMKSNGFNCDSTFPDDYPLKLIQMEKNKLIVDAVIEEINKCKNNLTIITKPQKTLLYINKEKKGESNASGIFEMKIKQGQYSIKASKEGYYDSVRTVEFNGQGKVEIFELRARLFSITFDIEPQDAEIYLLKENNLLRNKKLLIENNVLDNLKLGEYIFKIKKEGYKTKEQYIYINKNEKLEIKLNKKIVPLPPENVSAEVFNDKIIISWDKTSNANKYILYYSENEDVKESNNFFVTEAASFTIKDLPKDKKYFFGVTGLNEESEESDIEQIVSVNNPNFNKKRPAPPQNARISPGTGAVFVEWDKNEGAISYNLYYKEGVFDSTEYRNWKGKIINYIYNQNKTIENLTQDKKYSFAVTTVDRNGESDFSNIVTIIIPGKRESEFIESNIVFQKKYFLSFEYQDIIRKGNNKTLKDININYIGKLIKWDCKFNNKTSFFINTGVAKIGVPEEYGDDTFVYGGGLNMDVLNKDIYNFEIKLDFLNLKNEKNLTQQKTKRKIELKEYKIGLKNIFNNNPLYSPYIGINFLMLNGKLSYTSDNLTYNFNEDKKSNLEYFFGINIDKKTHFFDFEIFLSQTLNNYSFKIGTGKCF